MKKFIVAIMALAISFSMSACGSSSTAENTENTINIETEKETKVELSEEEYIKKSMEWGTSISTLHSSLSHLVIYEINYLEENLESSEISEDMLSYAYEQLDKEQDVKEDDIYVYFAQATDYEEALNNPSTDKEKEWNDILESYYTYTCCLFSTAISSIDKYENTTDFVSDLSKYLDETGNAMDDYSALLDNLNG